MIINKTYKVRIYPNEGQKNFFAQVFGSCRFLFNQMLEERIKVYKTLKDEKLKLYNHKYRTEKQFKEEFEWLKIIDSISLQQSRIDLQRAYNNFFRRVKSKKAKAGFPKFKSRYGKNSYRTHGIKLLDNKIKLPKIGWIKIRDSRVVKGELRNATISKTKSGKYFISILTEQEIKVKEHKVTSRSKVIGLDYDSKNFITDSLGKRANYPRFYRLYEEKLAKEQKELSKKTKGSNNRNKQRIKVARVHEKIVNSRKDFQHKLSNQIVEDFDLIGIEDLNMVGITRALNLAKSTLDNSWGSFVEMLEYKAAWKGKVLIKADRFFPSSKMCNSCGSLNKDLTLSDRHWECSCGVNHDRDLNAGINLANYAIKNTA